MSDVGGDFRRQLPSMIGMAGMFVATIFLAMYIRPWYDKAGLQAFGEAGASQLRFIALELVMIFIFTAAILLLAKYKKEWVIKYGIMGILFIALLYAFRLRIKLWSMTALRHSSTKPQMMSMRPI